MKISICTIFLLSFFQTTEAQDPLSKYALLDQSLIALWNYAHTQNGEKCIELANEIDEQLKTLYSNLDRTNSHQKENKKYKTYTAKVILVLLHQADKKNFKNIKFFAIELLYENYSLRDCFEQKGYPLDAMMLLSESYTKVHKTVEDPMMDLLEWFEFSKQVNEMVDRWEKYNCIPNATIQKYFPHISGIQHQLQKEKANNCLNDFLGSLESGYRKDFILPCEDLGDALSTLMKLYGHEARNDSRPKVGADRQILL